MKITENKVGTIHYTLKNDSGVTLDTSDGKDPIVYIQGKRNLIIGMENALEGKEAGDKFQVTISPEDGYGKKNEQMINEVPRENFPKEVDVTVGMQFQAETPEGIKVATVIKVEGEQITIDFNHPLADQILNFDIEVIEVREATPDELSHGHVHGEGCNH